MTCRAYLKSVAKKLAEDVDNLKNTAGTASTANTAGTMGRVSYRKAIATNLTVHVNLYTYLLPYYYTTK